MKRLSRALLLPLLLSAAAATSACNVDLSPYAAKVGGGTITSGQLDSALKKASGDGGFRCLLERSASGTRVKGLGQGTYDSSFVAFVLTNLIDSRVARLVAATKGLREPASARTLAAAQVKQAFANELGRSQCGGSPVRLERGLGPSLYGSFVGLQLDEDAIAARAAGISLTPSGLRSYETSHPAATKESCLSGIIVTAKSKADHLRALLHGGASFAALADKYSISKGSPGGALGCYTAQQLSSVSAEIGRAISKTGIGSVTAPLAYQGDYLILLVTSRPYEPPVDLVNQIFTLHSKAFSAAISRTASRAGIAVNPQYGRWVTTAKASPGTPGFGGSVVPASGPKASYLLNKSVTRARLQPSTLPGAGASGVG